MERTALAPPRVHPAPLEARKTEWLRGVLAHHHCPDPGAENEIVVLATGIDQYLQEVFHHLSYPGRDDTVSAEDFSALCTVLGLPGAPGGQPVPRRKDGEGEKEEQIAEFNDICCDLPHQLSFKDFHSRLCGYFRVHSASAGTGARAWRMPVSEDTELVERQIRLRWPRLRRRKCVSFDLTKDRIGPRSRSSRSRTAEDVQPDEVGALRELVEDLRSALQSSDARCLALQVALRRTHHPYSIVSTPTPTITSTHYKPADRCRGLLVGAGGDAVRWDIRDPVHRELKLIRSSRDGQLEEAMRFNEHLEVELLWAYQEVRKLQGVESSLRKENFHIRKRAEEAREALRMGLQRVQLIQEQAQSVPQLQSRISRLQEELLQYRSCCTCLTCPVGGVTQPDDSSGRTDAECLQRAVEGRAASDEEEEDRGMRKSHTPHLYSYGQGLAKIN